MTVVLGGTLTWWSSVGLHAPGFLGWTVGPVGTAVSAPLVVAGVLMVGALALAVGASWRIGRHLARIAD